MAIVRDWQRNKEMWVRVLERQTGAGLAYWNRRIMHERLEDRSALEAWLQAQGVTGYAKSLLLMERFGYPDFVLASASELVERQYRDREQLRAIYDAVLAAAMKAGEVIIQARKTYVSLVARRTFARVQPTTKTRVDLGLRLDVEKAHGRLVPSRIHPTMPVQVGLSAVKEVDAEVRRWLRQAYIENK